MNVLCCANDAVDGRTNDRSNGTARSLLNDSCQKMRTFNTYRVYVQNSFLHVDVEVGDAWAGRTDDCSHSWTVRRSNSQSSLRTPKIQHSSARSRAGHCDGGIGTFEAGPQKSFQWWWRCEEVCGTPAPLTSSVHSQ
eukprot:gnl/TRDRNA2_/TRDRNA2_133863_c0_seq1.p1 gnl/TRDRNA2_/TRDRNA2_133863_c0~~gnl/TRDRNA2_/TRDRNA2_133863_c0_seq1.p1  ORF type:complete len:137 (-),score=4.73 gnl/TRDRNA2_/TRDRNA2_133863_c0_seq1:17-427(-)